MRKKRFILALQPHEASQHTDWSPRHKSLAFCASLLFLVGLAFPMSPDVWQENVRVGLLRYAYGWQASPLMSQSEAVAWYSDLTGKVPKNGCNDAQVRDWNLMCYVIQSQGMGIDCENANKQSKTEILRNMEKSKTAAQYACLYG